MRQRVGEHRADERRAGDPLGGEPRQLEQVLCAAREAHHHRPLGAGRIHHGQAVAGELGGSVALRVAAAIRAPVAEAVHREHPEVARESRGSASSSGGSGPATTSGSGRRSPRPRRRPRRRAADRRARRSPRRRDSGRDSARRRGRSIPARSGRARRGAYSRSPATGSTLRSAVPRVSYARIVVLTAALRRQG